MLLPFYLMILVLVFLAGFSALLLMPGLKGDDVDQSFLRVVQTHYPAWVLGAVAGAGCLAALVPGGRESYCQEHRRDFFQIICPAASNGGDQSFGHCGGSVCFCQLSNRQKHFG
jgi:hypothetical protein